MKIINQQNKTYYFVSQHDNQRQVCQVRVLVGPGPGTRYISDIIDGGCVITHLQVARQSTLYTEE